MLGSSVGTVKANLFHALGNLQEDDGGGAGGASDDGTPFGRELMDVLEGTAGRRGARAPRDVRGVPRAP